MGRQHAAGDKDRLTSQTAPKRYHFLLASGPQQPKPSTIRCGVLVSSWRESVDGYLAVCAKMGKPPQKPYSGQIMVRVDPQVHARAALAAELAGNSLAKWTEEWLREDADRVLGS